jgi:hypothetical protein
MKVEFSLKIFEKYSNVEFHKKILLSGNRVVLCGQTGEQTGMTKLTVAFRHFAKAPNNGQNIFLQIGSDTVYGVMRTAVL